jgi:ribosomal protein S18 acetylase RimI-like enzyme
MTTIEPSATDLRTPTRVPGLFLRPVRWPEEVATITDIHNESRLAAGGLSVRTAEGFLNAYGHAVNCDLSKDLRLAEADGRPVGYARVSWGDEVRGDRVHDQAIFVRPDAPAGTLDAVLYWAEGRCREIAASLPADRPAMLGAFLGLETVATRATLEERGYRAVRYSFGMVRPTLDDIPDRSLPDGVEVRPVRPEHLRAIWAAEVAAFAGHWGTTVQDGGEAGWEEFRNDPLNDFPLWQVAWAGDTVVGMVRPFIRPEEFAVFEARRGWTESISTHPDWRGRGIAKALIARALAALRERGMTEAALGVDAGNETGALAIYRSMGFVERSRQTDYRKPFVVGEAES